MKFEPLQDRVLIQRVEAETTYHGVIHLPDKSIDKPQEGLVIAVGAGHYESGELIEPIVKPGDKILFGKYSGTDIKLDGIDYIIMREGDILGVLHE